MIIAKRKPFDEILEIIRPYKRILVLGCGGCVTVCNAGGEKEAGLLAAQLRVAAKTKGLDLEAVECETITRQCDPEFIDSIGAKLEGFDAILSTACGVGVNFVTQRLAEKLSDRQQLVVLPALDTSFYGATVEAGEWREMCSGCGHCVLHLTGGLCPVARCAKSLSNGPCGGSNNGKCEISSEVDCVWAAIVERMEKLGRLDELEQIQPPRDWSTARDGGPRKIVREDLKA